MKNSFQVGEIVIDKVWSSRIGKVTSVTHGKEHPVVVTFDKTFVSVNTRYYTEDGRYQKASKNIALISISEIRNDKINTILDE